MPQLGMNSCRLNNERPGTDHVISGPLKGLESDHVISGPMRGLKKTHGEWTDRHTDRRTDGHRNSTTELAQLGRFSENYLVKS